MAEPGVVDNMNANGGVFTLNQSDVQGVGTLSANNPNIEEETGETTIFGVVWTPEFVPGLLLTLDYWDIEIEDAINRVSTSTVLNKCYVEGLSEFCDFVSRRPVEQTPFSAGAVDQVIRGLVNSGGSWAEGIDLTSAYVHDLWNGQVSYSLSYTHLIDKGIIPLTGDPENESAGEIGDPENRWFATVGYDADRFSASLLGQFIGESYLDDVYWMARYGADAGKDNFKVDSVFYVDAQVKYRFGENYEVYLGAKNLFDEDPPLLYAGLPGGSSDYGTNPGVYDAIGRRWYLGLRASF
jgi:outer membrane receptor protein involved in Fe transport